MIVDAVIGSPKNTVANIIAEKGTIKIKELARLGPIFFDARK